MKAKIKHRSKIMSNHYQILFQCINFKNQRCLFFGNMKMDLILIKDALNLINASFDLTLNNDVCKIKLENGSKMIFMNDITDMDLTGMKFDITHIHESQ